MNSFELAQHLRNSPFQKFLAAVPDGAQLPSFLAVVNSLKPAMDLWVRAAYWQGFQRLAAHFGLLYHVDAYFDRQAEAVLSRLAPDSVTTTRAVFAPTFGAAAEAHVFIARDKSALLAAVGAGWYPLVVERRLIEKHLADHDKFGAALGYPGCCRGFFRLRNNWRCDNTCYAAYRNTSSVPQTLANGLLRHTAFCFAPHLPCAFDCHATMAYGANLRALLRDEAPEYASACERLLASPMLCLSELRSYRFDGELTASATGAEVRYTAAWPVSPTGDEDALWRLLAQGDACTLERNVIRVFRKGVQVGGYFARADQHGPELPFIIQCASSPG